MASNKKKRPSAAEQSKPKKGSASGRKKPGGKSAGKASVGHSRKEKDAAASVKKGARSARGVGPACEKCGEVHRRCSAHNRFGGPCMQVPLRFQQVCRSHGGATKLSKQAAQERMMELVYPALARLEQLVLDPDTDPAIIVKVCQQIFDRAHGAGLSRNATLEIGLGGTEFDKLLSNNMFSLDWDREEIANPDRPALGGGDDDALDAILDRRERERAREASTRLPQDGHDVVTGEVIEDPTPTKGAERGRTPRGRTTDVGPVSFPDMSDPRQRVRGTEMDPDAGRYSRRRTQRDLYEDPEGS